MSLYKVSKNQCFAKNPNGIENKNAIKASKKITRLTSKETFA